ncbi:EutP/PduV family microcompartment system protein [Limosilactobacillus reuteri]|uniref:EutP/PduV family microcompartment system protein n=1 Tax=Limosilactobacillus reuteri TaxID=1598 RepID=UPI000A1F09E8|nr:EutP/PduV family microcompartment system protein [Limosilactobacillus reuteri]MCC4440791.1 EutP/PduV family microcompartment system protein [Limosilactobacillus reuteri]
MKRTMLIGAIGSGKTTLIQRLTNEKLKYNKTQSIEYSPDFIDTPGEYIEHHNMESSLRVISMNADIIVLLQSAIDKRLVFPVGFCTMFNKPALGLITKIDQVKNSDDIKYSKNLLLRAGVDKVIPISSVTGENIEKVQLALK